jgi:transposase
VGVADEETPAGKRRRFSAEYKAEAVRLVGDSGKSIGVIAWELGLGETTLHRWVQQAEINAGRGPTGALTTANGKDWRTCYARASGCGCSAKS